MLYQDMHFMRFPCALYLREQHKHLMNGGMRCKMRSGRLRSALLGPAMHNHEAITGHLRRGLTGTKGTFSSIFLSA